MPWTCFLLNLGTNHVWICYNLISGKIEEERFLNSGKTEKNVITQTFFFVYLKIKEENNPIAVICTVLHMIDGYRKINDMNGTERSNKRVA